ncbi:MAG: magnesium-translocating P-type ATPase [Clostridiales bacterium]|jgi:Mg2+-importing ATPase|nr:magnesium-translocating P-type ATPase [Clostridiales bacterium]
MRSKKNTSKTEQIRMLQKRQLEKDILLSSILNEAQLYMTYDTNQTGFSKEKAEELLDEKGENVISYGKRQSIIVRFLLSFTSPFSIVLLLVAAVSYLADIFFSTGGDKSWATVVIILSLVGISGVVQFVQETKSDSAAKKLKAMVSSNAAVLREGAVNEIPMPEIVPGDIVTLSAGDMLPADLRILSAKDLFIGQAALTGESEPIEKFAEIKEPPKSVIEAPNIGFMGTNVISGSARAIVIGTGNQTYLGLIAQDLTGRRATSSFEKGVGDVSNLLLRLMLVMAPVIFVINGVTKNDWVNGLLFALSVAVGITPELLPMIMTSTLAKGALYMANRKTIVKNLSSIQSFGAMDVLCTDKTGTLTQDKIILEKYLDIHGHDDMRVLRNAYLNSYFQTGMKNLMDLAIIARAKKEGYKEWDNEYTKLDEIPFDFNRRRMSVVIEDSKGKRKLLTKGAIEEMLNICGFALQNGNAVPITPELRHEILKISDGLNEQGLRAIAVAQKNHVSDVGVFSVNDEKDMVLNGFVAFLDPPKESTKEAIQALDSHGVRVIVLTGDNGKVAVSVCKQVGLDVTDVMSGEDIDKQTDEELKKRIAKVNLFAKLSPSQKSRVVRLLQEDGHTVGYMGDGINDAPALHQSDVGISVDSGVDIAKESADIILLEKSLMVLEEGVLEGRRTFGNIVKYIKMAASGNFGNMFSVLAASIFLPFLPMLPIQILAQNLLYDFSQIAIPLDRMDNEYLRQPQKWNAKGIAKFMYFIGPISSLFDIATFIILFFVFQYNSDETAHFFQTGWFIVGLLTQTLIVHLIRTTKIPFVESRASLPLLLSTVVVSIVGIVLPYTFIGDSLEMAHMPLVYLPWVLGILLAYVLTMQAAKAIYMKKFGEWI